ncbi:NAD(+)/NADH kinase [Halococcus saccharolyticus]|nr:inositol monophosphatase family protein [Halococcus saccharolyticus]
MNGRRLATTERLIVIHSPDSDGPLERVRDVADDHDIEMAAVPVGDPIADVVDRTKETFGVTLGGDGTFFEGVRAFAPREIPFIGVNTGTLAFLATVSPADIEPALEEALQGHATVNERQQLQVTADGIDSTGINDVMIEPVPPENAFDRKITRLEVFVDGEYVGEYDGSGVAVATPTGSTGVSLSAGGPVHFPKNNGSLQVIPLHTHRMGVRPLVVDATSEIEIVSMSAANLLVDGGRAQTQLDADDVVTVSGADATAKIVTTSYDDDFFTSVSEKLGWSVREDRDDRGSHELVADRDTGAIEGADLLTRAQRVAEEAARSVGEPLRELHGETESVEHKSDAADVVTEADYKSEKLITTIIDNEFPGHGIYSEESVAKEADGEYTWLLDPLDGTGNFANGNPNYAVSIALVENGEPVVGVVYAPETDELFSATVDGEARRNGEPIAPTDRDRLEESVLLSGYDPDGSFLSHCYHETRGVRRLGAAALNLCYLASGSADAVWEYDTYPWDVAAGVVIARAAGATVTNRDGSPYTLDFDHDARNDLLGTNGSLHSSLVGHLEGLDAAVPASGD